MHIYVTIIDLYLHTIKALLNVKSEVLSTVYDLLRLIVRTSDNEGNVRHVPSLSWLIPSHLSYAPPLPSTTTDELRQSYATPTGVLWSDKGQYFLLLHKCMMNSFMEFFYLSFISLFYLNTDIVFKYLLLFKLN